MFGPVDQALFRTITDATSRAEPTITRIEFAPGHEDERLTDESVAAKLRVMKAAPKLLESVRELSQMLSEWHADMPDSVGDNEPAAMARARAAIAEATGSDT